MKSLVVSVVLSGVVACLAAPLQDLSAGAAAGMAARVAPKHVVFVGWDGFGGRYAKDAPIPTVRRMMAEGSWTLISRAVVPNSSTVNWHSFFTCSSVEQHGFCEFGSFFPKFRPTVLTAAGRYPDFPTLLRQQRPQAETGLFHQWTCLTNTVDVSSFSRVTKCPPGSDALTKAAVSYMAEKKPLLTVVVYDHPDIEGHHDGGWGSPAYMKRLGWLDEQLAAIVDALKKAGMQDDTVVMVSSDHGGYKDDHGNEMLEGIERPVVLWGKGVRKGYELKRTGTVYDTGATLAALLGIDPCAAWIGRPFDEAFEVK